VQALPVQALPVQAVEQSLHAIADELGAIM